MSSLSHHGVKGQKWGVRRYQNKDGTRTAAGKKRYSVEAVDVNSSRKEIKKLVKGFSRKDKEFFFGEEDWYRDYDSNGDRVAKRFVIKEGKNIVAFIDAERGNHYYSNESLNVVVGTAQSARGKGYASILSKTMVDWYEAEGYKDANMLEWNANKDNIGSRKAAEKAGFKEVLGDEDVGYRYSKNAKKELDELSKARMRVKAIDKEVSDKINSDFKKTKLSKISPNTTITPYGEGETGWNSELGFYKSMVVDHYATKWAKKNHAEDIAKYTKATSDWDSAYSKFDKKRKAKHTSIGGTMYIEGNALILGDSSYLEHHGILGQKWGVRRFQNKDGTRTAAGKKRDAENLKSSQEAKNVNSKIHSYINKQLSSEDLDTGKSNYDFASNLIKDPDFEKVIMPVVQDIRQTKAKYGNKEPYEFTGDEHQAYMNDIDRIDNKAGELAITIGLAEKGEPHKKSTSSEEEYERVDMFRYALARYLDEHSPDGYSDEGDWIYHSSMDGTFFIEDGTLYLSHHGIRGQRWGIRRFQNRDGSLTNAGRKRLGYATKGAAQTVGKAFKAGVKAGGNAVKAVKAHHEKKEAEKLQKKKEKASKTRLGVMANKDLFTNEEMRKLNERFKLEDEMKMATLQKGVEIAKAVGTIAQNVGTVAKTYEDVTGQSLSPIKRKAAEEKARQDKEDRERRIAREDADEARKAAKEERDIAIHEQSLRKAIALADTQEFTAQKTKAEADSSILDLYKKGQDFNGGTDATGQSWVEKAKSGGKNPFDDMIANRDPEYAQIRKEHDEKVARKERIAELERREKEREAEKAATSRQNTPQQKQGGGDDALFSQKSSLPIDKDRYRNNRAMEKAKQIKENAAEERAKKQDERAVNQTINDTIEANRSFKERVRAQDPHAYDRSVAKDYIKGKLNNLPNTLADLNPVNRAAKKIADKATKEEEAHVRKSMKDQYDQMVKSDGRDEANYVMYQTRVANLQQQGYSERKAKQIADSDPTFSAKRNRKKEYYDKVGELETTHRKNAQEIKKANKELTDYYYELRNSPGYESGTPKREALDRKYAQKRGELDRLEKDNNEMLEKGTKEAKKILEHSFSIQNGVLFVDSSDYLSHHGIKGQRWGVRRFQNPDGTLTDKGRKHYEKAIEKLDRKQVNSDNRRGALERRHPYAVTASAILTGSAYAALMVASAANPAMVVAGSAIAASISALGTHVDYSVAEAWEARGTRRRKKKRKEYEEMLNHDGLIVSDGTLYLEHHGIKGQRWGVRRFQNPDGTRTEAGKKHDAKLAAKAERKQAKADMKAAKAAAKAKAKDMKLTEKAENLRKREIERYEKKAVQQPRYKEAYEIMGKHAKESDRSELLQINTAANIRGTGQAIVSALVLSTFVPTPVAVAGGIAIAKAMKMNNVDYARTVTTNARLNKEARERKLKEAQSIKLEHSSDGLLIQNGTLFIDATDPYLEHHGVLGMKWGKHLRAGKGPADAPASAGGGGGEDDEKLKEMAKKAGMTVAEYKQKFASKIGGAVYNAAGGKYKDAAEVYRKHAHEESNEARRSEKTYHEQSAAAQSYKRKYGDGAGYNVAKGSADTYKEDAEIHKSNAKLNSDRAGSMQSKYEKSLAGRYDKMKADRARKKSAKEKHKLLTGGSAEAKRVSVKDKHLVIDGSRSGNRGLAVGETGEKPKSFKEKAYNALGGKYKTQAADAHREMVQKRNEADDKSRRANAQGRAARLAKRKGAVQDYIANKEGAIQLEGEAKYTRNEQWDATKKANSAQWKYDHSIAGLYDKATGKYKQVHKKTAVPNAAKRSEYNNKTNNKLYDGGKTKPKTAKEQARAEVWKAADHMINSHDYYNNSFDPTVTTYGYDTAFRKKATDYARLAEGSYRRAAALGKQAANEGSTSSRPRARKKRVTSGGSGVNVRKPGRKPVSRTKRVTKSSTGVKRRGATGTGARVRRGA